MTASAAIEVEVSPTETPEIDIVDIVGADDEQPVVFPEDAYFTGWLGELTNLVCQGTTLPKTIADSYQRVIIGILLDGHTGWEGTAPIHTRVWAIHAAPPGGGKGELWKRFAGEGIWADSESLGVKGVYHQLLTDYFVERFEGIGSGEAIISALTPTKDNPVPPHRGIVRFDETSTLMSKSKREGSIILQMLRTAFDNCKLENRTVKRGKETVFVRLGFVADIQPQPLDDMLGANDLQEGGFLRRVVFAQHDKTGLGDLVAPSPETLDKIQSVIAKIGDRVKDLKQYG